MVHGLLGGDALGGLVVQHLGEEVEAVGVEGGDHRGQALGAPLGVLVPVHELAHARPHVFVGGAKKPDGRWKMRDERESENEDEKDG